MNNMKLGTRLAGGFAILLAMIIVMLMRPRGLWPSPEHGKSLKTETK